MTFKQRSYYSLLLRTSSERQTANVYLYAPKVTHRVHIITNGIIQWLFRFPMRDLVSHLSRILRFVPKSLVASLFSDWPAEQFDTLWSFLKSPASVLNSLSMANEEMLTIKELDISLLNDIKHKLYFYFAEKDDWVGENKRAILREMADEPHSIRVTHGRHGIPHAYCISTLRR